jgi:hypothetical protein
VKTAGELSITPPDPVLVRELQAAGAICDYCETPSDALVTYSDGATICLACRQREQTRVEAAFREAYGPDFDTLATYQAEGR